MEMAWSAGVRCMTPLDLRFATLEASEGCIKVPPASSQNNRTQTRGSNTLNLTTLMSFCRKACKA